MPFDLALCLVGAAFVLSGVGMTYLAEGRATRHIGAWVLFPGAVLVGIELVRIGEAFVQSPRGDTSGLTMMMYVGALLIPAFAVGRMLRTGADLIIERTGKCSPLLRFFRTPSE